MNPETRQQFTDEEIRYMVDKINQIEDIINGVDLFLVVHILNHLYFRLEVNMYRELKDLERLRAN